MTPRLSNLLRYTEHGFYLSVAAAVSLAGAVLFVHVLYRFAAGLSFPLEGGGAGNSCIEVGRPDAPRRAV